jgi:hypothetical protein
MNLAQCEVCWNSKECTFPEGKCHPYIFNTGRWFVYPERFQKENVTEEDRKWLIERKR